MKIIADCARRFAFLESLKEEGKTVNEDGSLIEPYIEMAVELYEVPRHMVTFEMRNHVIKIVRAAVEKDIFNATFTQAAAAQQNNSGFNHWGGQKNPWGL